MFIKNNAYKILFKLGMKRCRFKPSDYLPDEKLYRGFRKADMDINGERLYANSIRFPDLSCNWARFAKPKIVRKRENGRPTDGCYSITVAVAQYKGMATPCHDPEKANYSHTEVRLLYSGESIEFEPLKNRKKKGKKKRLDYRQNIVNNLVPELPALA